MSIFEQITSNGADPVDSSRDPLAQLYRDLKPMVGWNDFAASLCDQWDRKGSWSEKQVAAAERMVAKVRAREAERAAAKASVDLSPILAMFEKAEASGYKRPIYRAAGVVLSIASPYSRNAGSIYVKSDETGDYLGKVTVDNEFHPVRGAAETAAQLATIAADPSAAAVAYGKLTGRCACCGRELTDPVSVERGIGPVCADRWGF